MMLGRLYDQARNKRTEYGGVVLFLDLGTAWTARLRSRTRYPEAGMPEPERSPMEEEKSHKPVRIEANAGAALHRY